MKRYIVRRLLQVIPVLWLSSAAVFLMIYIIPGNPVYTVLGADAVPDQIRQFHRERGLDRPLPIQYAIWLGRVLRGDFGKSFISGYTVFALIRVKLPATIELTLGAMIVALLISIPLGILSAVRPCSWIARLGAIYNAIGYATPTFWLGLLLSLFFGLWLRWLPASGYVRFFTHPLKHIRFLILPSLTLGVGLSVVLARFLTSALLEELGRDYIRTARAKGLKERLVVYRHAMKNALISVVTVFGLLVGTLMGGAVITESIFNWPGIGRALLQAILARDYPIVQGIILLVTMGFIIVNLLVDIAYAFLNPRIRYE